MRVESKLEWSEIESIGGDKNWRKGTEVEAKVAE